MNYPFKFKAAILEEIGKPLLLRDIQFRGPLNDGQILVKLFYSGICGKQIDEIIGNCGKDKFLPHLLGHEGSGVVIDKGPKVTKVKKGQNIILHWRKGSGIQSEVPFYFIDDLLINAGWVTTFNEYAVVSENRVTAIPIDCDMKLASLFGCVITTSYGVIFNDVKIKPSDNVLIYGAGGVGLCAIQAANYFNPKHLIAIDRNDEALKYARKMGADSVINNSKENVSVAIDKITGKKTAEKVLICTGDLTAIEEAIECTSIPGECFFMGVPPKGGKITIEANPIMHERNLIGSLGGNTYPDKDIPKYFELHSNGSVDLSKLISHVDEFSNINACINKIRNGSTGRFILKF